MSGSGSDSWPVASAKAGHPGVYTNHKPSSQVVGGQSNFCQGALLFDIS